MPESHAGLTKKLVCQACTLEPTKGDTRATALDGIRAQFRLITHGNSIPIRRAAITVGAAEVISLPTVIRAVAYGDNTIVKRAQVALGLEQQASLFLVYYNFCMSHASLRLPLVEPQPTRDKGSLKKWQQRTLVIAAGLTGYLWSWREVLLYRIPPWPQAGAKV